MDRTFWISASASAGAVILCCALLSKHWRRKLSTDAALPNLVDCVGNTPLLYLSALSSSAGVAIYGKCEFLNPGGSVKDRVAHQIIDDAEKNGELVQGGTVFEGSVGSTGISLALACAARGYRCHICMPDDIAEEKSAILGPLGATVEKLPPVSISNPGHFVTVARRRASETKGGYFADQFNNKSNFKAHFNSTGPEILSQIRRTEGGAKGNTRIAFVSGAGTGGTLAGVSCYLKEKHPNAQVYLADPQGSSLYSKVVHGVLYTQEEAEGHRRRHQNDSIVEGVGLNRLTRNFAAAKVDGAFKVTDAEAIEMSRYLVRAEGLFLGSSSAVNCCACVKLARKLKDSNTDLSTVRIVTILCDDGSRYLSRFWGVA